jgi:hypothetical protein
MMANKKFGKRGATKIGLGGVILILLILLAGLYIFGFLKIPQQTAIQNTPQPPTEELVPVDLPLQLVFTNPLGTPISGNLLVSIYQGNVLQEQKYISSGGATSLPYKSGTALNIKVQNGTTVIWYNVIVPKLPKSVVQQYTSNPIRLNFIPLPSIMSLRVVDQFGDTSGVFNFTSKGTDNAILTITAQNTQLGKGFVSSFDPIYGIQLGLWVVGSYSDTKLIINGFQTQFTKGLTTYYMTQVPDTASWYAQQGQQIIYNGVYSFQINVLKGSLTSGQTNTITLKLIAYLDPQYFNQFGSGSPYAVEFTTLTLTFRA